MKKITFFTLMLVISSFFQSCSSVGQNNDSGATLLQNMQMQQQMQQNQQLMRNHQMQQQNHRMLQQNLQRVTQQQMFHR